MRFKAIFALVNDDYQEDVITAAKEAGATGATILNARGEGIHNNQSFLGLTVESQKDLLLFLVEDFNTDQILDAIYKAGKLNESGNGIAFSLLVDRAIGLESQLPTMEKEVKDSYI